MSDERALTIKQPYASLIVAGIKDVENRSWPVPSTLPQWCESIGTGGRHQREESCRPWSCRALGLFPFRLWIHAGKEYPHRDDAPEGWAAYEQHVGIVRALGDALSDAEYYEPWTGVLLGSVLVTGCHYADECYRGTEFSVPSVASPHGHIRDRLCSPWAEPDAYHWTLADPQPLPESIPMKGRQGLWRLPNDVVVPA